jgi:hypothetical protein
LCKSSGNFALFAAIRRAASLLANRTIGSFWNHDAEVSESNNNRLEARERIRKANRSDDNQNKWA